MNESKTLTKHKSCGCKCKFMGRTRNSNQKWNNDKGWCNCKYLRDYHVCEKDVWNPTTLTCENLKYLGNTTTEIKQKQIHQILTKKG